MHGYVVTGRIPRAGNALTRVMGRFCLRLFGWRIEGELPNTEKFIIVVAPHTSNWDFIFGMAVVFATGLQASWLGKSSIFRPPWGGILRWLGGISVDRSAQQGVVEQSVRAFHERDQLVLCVTPEGTRKQVAE